VKTEKEGKDVDRQKDSVRMRIVGDSVGSAGCLRPNP
jgi:hypothetical protein